MKKIGLFMLVLVLSVSLLACSTSPVDNGNNDNNGDSPETEQSSKSSDVTVEGDVPQEIVEYLKEGFADTYDDIVIRTVTDDDLERFRIVFIEEGAYVIEQTLPEKIDSVWDPIRRQGLDPENVNIIIGFTQEGVVEGFERAYHFQMWFHDMGEWQNWSTSFAAPLDHPRMESN